MADDNLLAYVAFLKNSSIDWEVRTCYFYCTIHVKFIDYCPSHPSFVPILYSWATPHLRHRIPATSCHGFLIFHLVTCVTMWHMLHVSHHFWSPNLESHRCDMCDSVTLVTWYWLHDCDNSYVTVTYITVTTLLTQPWYHTSWLPHGYLMFTSCWCDSQHDSVNESDNDSPNDSDSDSDSDSFNESDSETSCASTGI